MRYITYILLAVVLLVSNADLCYSESLQVTSTPAPTAVKHGDMVAMSVNLKNILTTREPAVITAEIEWEDEYGAAKLSTTSATVTINQPVKLSRYKLVIPSLFAFVAGSAKVYGQPVTPATISDGLLFELAKTLLEGESLSIDYSVKVN